jgi:hypothetical protein
VEGDAEGLLPGASAFPDENILLPLQVSLRERQKKSCLCAPAPLEFSHFFLYFFVAFAPGGGGTNTAVPQTELTWAREAENATVLAPTWEDAESLARKVALLEGDLAEAR